MTQASKSISSIKSNVYALNPSHAPKTHFIIINPDGTGGDIEYKSWSAAVSECRNLDGIGDAVEAAEYEFRNEFDGYTGGEHFAQCFKDYLEDELMDELLKEHGYRVLKVIR